MASYAGQNHGLDQGGNGAMGAWIKALKINGIQLYFSHRIAGCFSHKMVENHVAKGVASRPFFALFIRS